MHLTIWVSKFSGNTELWFSSKEEINPISVGLAASDSGRLFARQCNLWFLCIQCNSSWEDCDLTGQRSLAMKTMELMLPPFTQLPRVELHFDDCCLSF